MSDAIRPDCSKMRDTETSACIDNAGTMDNNGPKRAKDKVNIVARKKQTDANNKIYYAMHLSKNRTLTMPDKTNKTPILISF